MLCAIIKSSGIRTAHTDLIDDRVFEIRRFEHFFSNVRVFEKSRIRKYIGSKGVQTGNLIGRSLV